MPSKRLPIEGEKNDIELHDDRGYDPDHPNAILLVQNDGDEQTFAAGPPGNARRLSASPEPNSHGLVLVYRLRPPNAGAAWKDRHVDGPVLVAKNFFGRSFFNGPEFISMEDGSLGIIFSGWNNDRTKTELFISIRPPGAAWDAFSAALPLASHPDPAVRTATPTASPPEVYYPAPSNPVPKGTVGVWAALFTATVQEQPLDFLVGKLGDDTLLDARKPVADHLNIDHTRKVHSLAFHPTMDRALLVSARDRQDRGAIYGVFPSRAGNSGVVVQKIWPIRRRDGDFEPARSPRWGSHLRGGTLHHPKRKTVIWFANDHGGNLIVFTEDEGEGEQRIKLVERARFAPPFANPAHGHFHVVERDDGVSSEVRLFYRMGIDEDNEGLYMVSVRADAGGEALSIDPPTLYDDKTQGVEPIWVGGRRKTWAKLSGRSPVQITE